MGNTDTIKETASKKKLIDAGKSLFFKYGYRKVTVGEICKAAGVSKMTFYRFFENKIDLVKFILTEIATEGWNAYEEIRSRDISFEEKVRATIQMKYDAAEQFSDDLLKDVYEDQETGLFYLLKDLSTKMMVQLMDDYRQAQSEGHIRKDLNLNFIPYFLGKINGMINEPALLAMYDGNIREVMRELTNLFFYGILEPDQTPKDEK